MNDKVKRLTSAGMLIAMAFLMVALIRIPLIPSLDFLRYEPKDVIITLGGLIWGPVTAISVIICTAFLEMITISSTGFWGFLMNVIASMMFALPVSILYKKKKGQGTAAIGLLLGVIAMTGSMLLWNYLITPIYMGYPREAVAAMLIPGFLPFNLIKSGINAVLTFILYKPVITALRSIGYVEVRSSLAGTVVHGKGFGHTIGFPTANLEVTVGTKLPPRGVYVTDVKLEGKHYKGITNVGTRPTVDESKTITVETYILDFDDDIYDKMLELKFIKRLRGVKKFNNIDELKAQIAVDKKSAEREDK